MSGRIRFAAAVVFAMAVVGCGANGGDPVAGQQIPAGQTDSPQQPAESASDAGSSSDQGGSGGGGGSDAVKHDRKVGLPDSIRITEISAQDFVNSIVAACGSKDGAPGCLTVTYLTSVDPAGACGIQFVSEPPATSANGSGDWLVQRGSSIDVTIVACPESGETTSPAPEDTMSPDDGETSTSDSPSASP